MQKRWGFWQRMWNLRYLGMILLVILASIYNNTGEARAIITKACNQVEFVFARGSGEPLGGDSARAWEANIRSNLASNSKLKYGFYELGSKSQNGFQYPAVAVSGSSEGIKNLLQAAVSGGEAYEFGNSVVEGAAELRSYIRQKSQSCPGTKFVLGGYSQGAMVLSRTLPELDPKNIIYAATFGDPKLYLPEGEGSFPMACLGRGYSEYRVDVEDCRAYEGILGSYRPYQPAGFSGKLGTWCNKNDVMCSSHWSLNDHTAYVSDNKYVDAARVIVEKVQAALPDITIQDISLNRTPSAKHNVAFIIDSTESMSDLIDQYKEEAKNMARQVLNEGGKIALFEYRDLIDPFWPVRHCDFSCDYKTFVQKIDEIRVDRGGDIEESALSAMMYAMNNLDWQHGANKSIVLLTDAGYHDPDRDKTTLEDVVERSLEIDPVNTYVITKQSVLNSYQELAAKTDGLVFDIEQDLELSTNTIMKRPVAKLSREIYSGRAGDEFYFDASESYISDSDKKTGYKLKFDWDLDGDGIYELANAGPTINQTFSEAKDRFIRVKVTDEESRFSTMSARVEFPDYNAPSMIWNLQSRIKEENLEINFSTSAKEVLVLIDEAVMGYINNVDTTKRLLIQDIRKDSTVTLVPFDWHGQRGESAQADVERDIFSQRTNGKQTIEETSGYMGDKIILPSVPNAGVFSAAKARSTYDINSFGRDESAMSTSN